jgi:hypothetical protein
MALGGLAPSGPQAPPSLPALAINVLHMPQMQAHWARLHLSAVERGRDSNGNDVSPLVSSSFPFFMPTPGPGYRRPVAGCKPCDCCAPLQWAPVGMPFFHPHPSSSSCSSIKFPAVTPLGNILPPSPPLPLSLPGGGIISSWRCLIYPKPRCRRPSFEKAVSPPCRPFVVPILSS